MTPTDIMRHPATTLYAKAHLDPRPCPVPPDWAQGGYSSIVAAQRT